MQILGTVLIAVGGIMCLIYSIMLLVAAFRTSVLWGLGCLFLFLPVGIIFIIMHWDVAKKPFLRYLVGLVLLVGGVTLNPAIQKVFQDAVANAQREAAQHSRVK